jgi:hypothetical protein
MTWEPILQAQSQLMMEGWMFNVIIANNVEVIINVLRYEN